MQCIQMSELVLSSTRLLLLIHRALVSCMRGNPHQITNKKSGGEKRNRARTRLSITWPPFPPTFTSSSHVVKIQHTTRPTQSPSKTSNTAQPSLCAWLLVNSYQRHCFSSSRACQGTSFDGPRQWNRSRHSTQSGRYHCWSGKDGFGNKWWVCVVVWMVMVSNIGL